MRHCANAGPSSGSACVADANLPASFHQALASAASWLAGAGVPGVVIGGVAASFLGRPRITRDVDLLIFLDEGRWREFLAAGRAHGFVPRRADAVAFARRSRVLLARHQASGIEIDIMLGEIPFEREVVSRALAVEIGGVRIPLPTPEDLVVLKAVAHRPRDLADIEGVLAAHPRLDHRRVLRWVRLFSASLDQPEILTDLQGMLGRTRRTDRGAPRPRRRRRL